MKIQAYAACSDNGDGSSSVAIFNTKEECLKHLDRTDEQLEEGTYYDDGIIQHVAINITPLGKLANPIYLTNIE